MLNTPWAEREIFKALQVIAAESETDLGEIIDALTGYAWGEEDREVLRKMIPDILADIEDVPKPTPEPPKPTGEQLKAIGKVLDGGAPQKVHCYARIWDGEKIPIAIHPGDPLIGTLRWHLKDAPKQPDFAVCKYFMHGVTDDDACTHPNKRTAYDTFGYCDRTEAEWRKVSCQDYEPKQLALMICNHAGECHAGTCTHKTPHGKILMCSASSCHLFPNAICVPWVEPAKHYSCIGCGCFPAYPGPVCESCFDRTTNPILRRNYTPVQPEPDEPVKTLQHALDTIALVDRECSLCQPYLTLPDRVQRLIRKRGDLIPKEPKAEPVVKENFTAVGPKDAPGLADKYHELLYQVCQCFPGESRHETALRYIQEAERKSTICGSACQTNEG